MLLGAFGPFFAF